MDQLFNLRDSKNTAEWSVAHSTQSSAY